MNDWCRIKIKNLLWHFDSCPVMPTKVGDRLEDQRALRRLVADCPAMPIADFAIPVRLANVQLHAYFRDFVHTSPYPLRESGFRRSRSLHIKVLRVLVSRQGNAKYYQIMDRKSSILTGKSKENLTVRRQL